MIVLIENIDNEFINKLDLDKISSKFVTNPFIRYLLFIDNDKLMGYLSFEYIYDRFEIDNLYVIPDYRNKKIASALLKYLIDYAIKMNVKNITLEVRKDNAIAIYLYKKYGFLERAIRASYYNGTDGILMEKEMI